MVDGRYERRAECEAIEKVHKKHHCYVPPEAWEISAATVCQVCRLKNLRLFVEVALELAEEPFQKRIPEEQLSPILIPGPISGPCLKERLCSVCGKTQIWIVRWEAGERVCGGCRFETGRRTCRFCGRSNIRPNYFSQARQMCKRKACLAAFLEELKVKKAG